MTRRPKRRPAERGATLLLVSFIMIIVLVGGLAAVAVTSGELASSRGYRTRQVTLACASAGIEQIRATVPDLATAAVVSRSLDIGGSTDAVTMRAGHYNTSGTAQPNVEVLDESKFDASSLFAGENITNVLGSGGGGGGGVGLQVIGATAVCEGSGYGAREMEIIFRYGSAVGSR